MDYDIWFHKDTYGRLWCGIAEPGEPPHSGPVEVESVQSALKTVRKQGHSVAQVGIADGMMIGLA